MESAARLVCLKTQQSCVTMLRPGTATCCVQSVHLLRKKVWTNSWLFVQQAMSIMCPANRCCCRNTGCHVDACDRCCTSVTQQICLLEAVWAKQLTWFVQIMRTPVEMRAYAWSTVTSLAYSLFMCRMNSCVCENTWKVKPCSIHTLHT